MKLKKILLCTCSVFLLASCGGTTYKDTAGNTLKLNGNSFTYKVSGSGKGDETLLTESYTWSYSATYTGSAEANENKTDLYSLTAKKLVINGSYTNKLGKIGLSTALALNGLNDEEINQVIDNGKKVTINYDDERVRSFVATVNDNNNSFTII